MLVRFAGARANPWPRGEPLGGEVFRRLHGELEIGGCLASGPLKEIVVKKPVASAIDPGDRKRLVAAMCANIKTPLQGALSAQGAGTGSGRGAIHLEQDEAGRFR